MHTRVESEMLKEKSEVYLESGLFGFYTKK